MYRYEPSGQYFARVRFRGKLYRRKLDTADLMLAMRKLRTSKDDLERTDAIYPQLRPLVEKLCNGKAHNQRWFSSASAPPGGGKR